MSALASELFTAIVPAPFGAVGIRTEAGALRELTYLPPTYKAKAPRDALGKDVARQINAYLADADFVFSLSLPEVGTVHQRKVWGVISSIARGDVLTYAEVARLIGSAPRAVGQACGANWFPVVIPCHRVIAAGGIGGFGGYAQQDGGFHSSVKRWLLQHEGGSGF
jgi:methylated-DNA-[protein]-cysteine S-methyltransferase